MKMKMILLAFILFTFAACEKDDPTTEEPLLKEGPLSAQLGKLINIGKHGYSRSVLWGRNSDELFITASTEILRLEITAKKVEVIESSGGAVTGKTNENSGIIFINQQGYHLFNFSTNSTEKIIEVPSNQGTQINIAGNNIFYYLLPPSSPGNPCIGFCWPTPGPYVPATFYHLDKQTQQITDLKNKRFVTFSEDGVTAILSSQIERLIFVFDNISRTVIDSADVNSTNSKFGLFFQNGVLQSFDIDIFGNITIKNFNTDQILRQYPTNKIIFDYFYVSADGTKLYYSGAILNGNSCKILLYDIATNTEKTLVDLPFLQGGAWPFDFFLLSDDNKKMLIQSGNDLYLKNLD